MGSPLNLLKLNPQPQTVIIMEFSWYVYCYQFVNAGPKYRDLKHCTTYYLVHGLRTLNEAFFHRNPKLLGLGRQIGQINFGAFGAFSAELSAPILAL